MATFAARLRCGKLSAQRLPLERNGAALVLPLARDEETSALEGDAELAQFVFAQHMGLARIHDEFRPSNTDAGDAQKACVGCLVHLNGKEIEMVECPIRFGVDL